MLTQQQNDALGEDTEEFYAEMEMEMLKASSHKLSDLEPDDTGKIPWLAIIGAAAALYAVHRGIVNRYASNVGPHVSRDVYGGFMLNAATELSGAEQNAEAILNDARQTAQTVAPIIIQAIQNRSQFIVNQANAAYLKEAARAAQMVGRGTNAKDAVASAVSALARQGVTYSTYTRVVNGVPQTVRVPVDVGIRREIRTEMCQRLANQVIGIAEQTGDNLVEVDFSTNPRESHAEWEGQIYQLNGSGEYQNFYIACRWGDMVDGYGGYNCQHNIAIYRGYRHFTDPLKGTGYTREETRELTAYQRRLENDIRKDRRERDALKEVGLPTASVNARLSNHKRQLDQLVSSHSVLFDQTWRTSVYAAASAEERRVAAARAVSRAEDVSRNSYRAFPQTRETMGAISSGVGRRLGRTEITALQKQSDAVYGVLSEQEKKAIDDYTSGKHNLVNQYLYGVKLTEPKTRQAEQIKQSLDSAISRYELNQDIVVFSGTNAEHYIGYEVGDVFPLGGFLSTSVFVREANRFEQMAEGKGQNPFFLELLVPKGTPGIFAGTNTAFFRDQGEFILKHGLKYRVVAKSDSRMTLEVVNE